jgi:hypothetical protein
MQGCNATTHMYCPDCRERAKDHKIKTAIKIMGYMVSITSEVTTFFIDKKKQFLSVHPLNKRSIVGKLNPSETKSDRYAGNSGAIDNIKKYAPITVEAKQQAIIEKQTQAYDIFNKTFDVAVYAVIPAVIVASLALMATVVAGLEMMVIGPLLATVGGIFLALMITQAVSFSLLCLSHKKVDEDVEKLMDLQLSRMKQDYNLVECKAVSQLAFDNSEEDKEKLKVVEVLNKCNPVNFVICIRDLNLARIHQSMDEYNDLIQSEITTTAKVIRLMDSELVSSFIMMLGSLFINDQNQWCTDNYKDYITTLKPDILTLLNSPEMDIFPTIINVLSRRNVNEIVHDKDYSLLKQAIIAKLETVSF